jgi:hypothetical protein
MAITNPQIKLLLVDLTAKEDSTPTSTDKQSFVDINEIKTPFDIVKYATLEDGQWEFNKQHKILPNDLTTVNWGYWSNSQSDVNGDFSVSPRIEVTFTTVHTSNGITIDFWSATNDFCDDVTISWYDNLDALITTQNFTPDSFSYFCNHLVENYKRVTIDFNATNKAYRFAKVQNIEYGEVAIFDETKVTSCDLTEELDLTTDKLTVNTIGFDLQLDTSARTEEILTVLQDTQKIEVTEFVNSVPVKIGTFYVSGKGNPEERVLSIEGQDLIGQFGDTDHLGGIYSGITVQTLVDEIMTQFDTDLYEIDPAIASLTISGWLPVQSCKDSLQDVAFAVNAVVDTSRGETIRIYRTSELSPTTLSRNVVFNYDQVDVTKQIKPVTGARLDLKTFAQSTETVKAYEETLASGTYTVFFTEPLHNLSIVGGTITASNANYATFTTTGATVTINGDKYDVSINTRSASITLSAGVKPNIVKFENTLTWDIDQNVEYLKTYETQTSSVVFNKVVDDVKVGDFIQINGYFGKTFSGFVVSNDADLANGFRGDVVAYGSLV